jgi:hypothetical protein
MVRRVPVTDSVMQHSKTQARADARVPWQVIGSNVARAVVLDFTDPVQDVSPQVRSYPAYSCVVGRGNSSTLEPNLAMLHAPGYVVMLKSKTSRADAAVQYCNPTTISAVVHGCTSFVLTSGNPHN